MKKLSLTLCVTPAFLLLACSSQPLTPQKDAVEAGRKAPSERCQSLGSVKGVARSIHGTAEQALDDLKQEAANKGATYVQVFQYSGTGTAVTGEAFKCP